MPKTSSLTILINISDFHPYSQDPLLPGWKSPSMTSPLIQLSSVATHYWYAKRCLNQLSRNAFVVGTERKCICCFPHLYFTYYKHKNSTSHRWKRDSSRYSAVAIRLPLWQHGLSFRKRDPSATHLRKRDWCFKFCYLCSPLYSDKSRYKRQSVQSCSLTSALYRHKSCMSCLVVKNQVRNIYVLWTSVVSCDSNAGWEKKTF